MEKDIEPERREYGRSSLTPRKPQSEGRKV